MNVRKEYENLLRKGYIPLQLFKNLKLDKNSIYASMKPNLYERYFGVLFFKKNDNKPNDLIYLYFTRMEDYNFLNKNISKYFKENTVGYDLYIYCSIIGIRAGYGRKFNIDNLVNSLKIKRDWISEKYEKTNTFCIHFKLKKNDNIDKYLNEVDKTLRVLSLRNQIGIIISDYSIFPYFKNIPISLQIGLEVYDALGINDNDLEIIRNIQYTKDKKLKVAVDALREYYSQFTNKARFLIGWSAIEEIFSTDAKHVLEKEELKKIIGLIKKSEFDNQQKKSKIIEIIKNPDILSKENRNERISRNISNCLDFNYDKVYSEIGNISRFRGKLAHQISRNAWEKQKSKKVEEIREKLVFLEITLKMYIEKKSTLRFNYIDRQVITKYMKK
jgi:hypothetical protein